MTSANARLASPCDASLSCPRSCPGGGRGTGPDAPIAGVAPGASPDRSPTRGAPTRVGVPADTPGKGAAPDRSDRRGEAELDTARRGRAGTPRTTRSSMPPLSGHGARAVMNLTASRHRRLPKAWGCRPGPSLIWRTAPSTPARARRPRSSPVNGERRRSRRRGLHRSDAGSGDRRHLRRLRRLVPGDRLDGDRRGRLRGEGRAG